MLAARIVRMSCVDAMSDKNEEVGVNSSRVDSYNLIVIQKDLWKPKPE